MLDRPAMATSIRQALTDTTRAFAAGGIAAAQLDARLLVGAALGASREDLARSPEALLDEAAAARLKGFVARRLTGEPVARITGSKEFWGMEFALNRASLVPRPDSETLVQAVLDRLAGRRQAPLRLADLGTGSGCLIIALLSELPLATAIATDIDPDALLVARSNADRHGVSGRLRTVCCDWAGGIDGSYDAIIANPPYIESRAIESLSREVARFDPRRALDGGADGLDAYRAIAPQAFALLKPGGFLAVEIGIGQETAMLDIAGAAGFDVSGEDMLTADLSGTWRVVSVSKSLMC